MQNNLFTSNQLLTTGVFLSALTYVGYQLKTVPATLWEFFQRKFLYTTCVRREDEDLYFVLELYLAENHSHQYRNTFSYVRDSSNPGSMWDEEEAFLEIEEDKVKTRQRQDVFIIRLGGRRVMIEKTLEKREGGLVASASKNIYIEEYRISGLFAKKQIDNFVRDIFSASSHRLPRKQNIEHLYVNNGDTYWKKSLYLQNSRVKPFSNIFIPDKEVLLNDLKVNFYQRRDWYAERNLTFKRGYLLHGSPGNGKSSLVMALARELKKNLFYLSLGSEARETDLHSLIADVKEDSFIVFEDVDATFFKRKAANDAISFSAFLNILDGPSSREGIVFFFTTNHIQNLDPALLRPGRIDMVFEINNPRTTSIIAYMCNFFDYRQTVREDKVELIRDLTDCSMAVVQECCIQSKSFEEALDKIIETGKVKQVTKSPDVSIEDNPVFN